MRRAVSRLALALVVNTRRSAQDALSSCWLGLGDKSSDGAGEWTYSAHWLSRER